MTDASADADPRPVSRLTALRDAIRAGRARRLLWLTFPTVVLIVFAVLVALDISGSSISVLVPPGQRTGLIGIPRGVRSDESLVRTPIAISSTEQGFPRSPWIGLAETEQAATAHGGPTLEWTTVFKPQDWGYIALGPSRGLSFSWWWSFVVSLLGCYALFGIITRAPILSALLAVIATFTPYAAWWTAPAPSLFLGYAAGVGALLIAAWSTVRQRMAGMFAVGAAVVSVAFALALYPPWQVTLMWVVALTCLGVALDRRLPWRRIAWTTAITVGLAGTAVVAWYLDHRAAIAAILNTYYPGGRVSKAGGADLAFLLDAPLNFWLARRPGATLGSGANLSEVASTWLSLPVLVIVLAGCVVAMATFVRGRRATSAGGDTTNADRAIDIERPAGPVWTLTLVSVAAIALLAWAFLPLPAIIGSLTQLNRVPPIRVWLALGLAALLQVAAISMIQPRPRWVTPALVVAAALTGATALWSRANLPWNEAHVSALLVSVSGIILGAGFAMLATRRWAVAGAAMLAVYAFVSWGLVNPVQRGLGAVLKDPLVTELQALPGTADNPRVEVFGDATVVAKVRIAGLQSLGGLTLYPDADLMGELAQSQERLWNNYAKYVWEPASPGSPAVISPDRGSSLKLGIDPCDPVLLEHTRPGWAVSATPLDDAACLQPVSLVELRNGQEFRIYRVTLP